MAKFDEIIKTVSKLSFTAIHPKTGSIFKVIVGECPESFVKEEDSPHYICTDFIFKPTLRRTQDPSEPEKTLEQSMLEFIIFELDKTKASLSILDGVTVTRLDFQHRLEKYGFKRGEKSKKIYYRLLEKEIIE